MRKLLALISAVSLIVMASPGPVSAASLPPHSADDGPSPSLANLSTSNKASAASTTTHFYVDAVNGDNLAGDGSITSPWQTISYALSQVSGPDAVIYIASGVYDESLGESFPLTMGPGVRLVGADRTSTIISGNGSDPVVHIPGTSIYTETTTISGFKITNGSSGVRVDGTGGVCSSAIVEGNWITGNSQGIEGVASASGWFCTIIRDNLISENNGYGIIDSANADYARAEPIIENNEIVGNSSGGIYCSCSASGYNTAYCAQNVRGNLISNNGGSGFECHTSYAGSCSPLITGNVIASNERWGLQRSQGLNYNVGNYPRLINNFIHSNRDGGAYFIYFSSYDDRYDMPTLVNNTIVYNNAYGVVSGRPLIVNCIVWGHNDDLDITVDRVSYSDIGDGEYAGVNHNISLEPQFADRVHSDYHILPTSPARDAGDSSHPDILTSDVTIQADMVWN